MNPAMFRCATVTQSEIEELRRIKNVVRMGRVKRIEPEQVILEKGSFEYGLRHPLSHRGRARRLC